MSIYTKTGDGGLTSLCGGQRVSKCCQRLESYGAVDELNSHLGLLSTYCSDAGDGEFLSLMQRRLFVVGGNLATASSLGELHPSLVVTQEMVCEIEAEIDRLQAGLPRMRSFILPGGTRGAAQAHVCRTVCRRCEREILRLRESGAEVDGGVVAFINRLSDYLFVLARNLTADEGRGDEEV